MLVPVDKHYLLDQLCKYAFWEKYNHSAEEYRRIDPPANVAGVISSRFGDWGFHSVAGVITTPTLRRDGTILQAVGYDNTTRLILRSPPSMPPIPGNPTKADAESALELLKGLLDEFPFVDDASKSVALSCLITPVVRGAIMVAPMHAISASMPGTGKSYLLDIAAAIAIGQLCPVISAGRTEEETEKRLGASVIAGKPIISIDNLNGQLGGDALCQIVERPIVDVRILGKSELARIETRSTVFANGNNIIIVGDMTRRVLLCTLDAEMERPETRQFNADPVGTVLADRGKYVAAALMVVRAYMVAGSPELVPRLASFEEWSDTVRSALMWLGCDDPVKTMHTAREADPVQQTIKAVFTAMQEAIGLGSEHQRTAAEIVEIATEKESVEKSDSLYKHPELREALINAAGNRSGHIGTKELGKWFGRYKGRICNGLKLEQNKDKHGHAAKWWLNDGSG